MEQNMLMPDLKTEAGRAKWDKRRADNLARLLSDIRADKAQHSGRSYSQRPRAKPDRFANSNFGMVF